ncbi:transcription termination factor Rho [Candidatus Margulisiibacteriota bacterium]
MTTEKAEKAEKKEKDDIKKQSDEPSSGAKGSRQQFKKRNEDKDNINADERLDIGELQSKKIEDLYAIAEELKIEGCRKISKHDLIFNILQTKTEQSGFIFARGVLEVLNEGYGFLRTNNYLPSSEDIYVSQTQIRRFDLSPGDTISGQVRPPKEGERYFSLLRIEAVNNRNPDMTRKRTYYHNLTPIHPDEKMKLETTKEYATSRLIDFIAPIGFGQRGMIVSPPKAGKTTILKDLAHSIAYNHPDVLIKVLLIDERPEEVTDMQRSVKGEVIYSTFDEPPEQHVRISELVLESAKRLVEFGEDVVILLDSITRLARAYNLIVPPSGRTLSGGLDPSCLHKPKRFFGGARNIEDGGSLTILATALVDTGSRMDDVIYEEFKGTGNMELHLDRNMANRRIYPAIDVVSSGTRKEELLLGKEMMNKISLLRKNMDANDSAELISLLKKTSSNEEFFDLDIFS